MPNIIGEEFKEYTANQINLRQEIHGRKNRTNKELLYLNSRTSWIKLASGVSIEQSRLDLIPELKGQNNYLGQELAKEFILFNGTQAFGKNPRSGITGDSLNPAYGMLGSATRKFGILPMPGIESVDIKSMEKGSIKRASLKIKAYNKTQFDIIDVLYLRLGYTLLLEWGDSHYLDNKNPTNPVTLFQNTILNNRWFDSTSKNKTSKVETNQFEMLKVIEKERENYSGCYDALFGRIVNFKWTFESDGTYNILLDIISLGDVVESLKMNIPPILPESDLYKFTNIIHNLAEKDKGNKGIIKPYQPKPKLNIIEQIIDKIRKVSDPYYVSFNATFFEDVSYRLKNNLAASFSRVVAGLPAVRPQDSPEVIKENENRYKYQQIFSRKGDLKGIDITIKGAKNNGEKKKADGTVEGTTDGQYMGVTIPAKVIEETGINNYYDPSSKNIDNQDSIAYHKITGKAKTLPIDYIQMNFQPPEYQYYIRLGAFLKLLQDVIFPHYNNKLDKKEKQPMIKIDCRVFDNLMYYVPNMTSIDPRVCIFNSILMKTDANGSRSNQPIFDIYPELEPFIKQDGDNSYGYLMNIYINFQYISELFKKVDKRGNVFLMEMLRNLCDGINTSLGQVNNLEPKIDDTINTITIYDRANLPNKRKLLKSFGLNHSINYEFEIFGYNFKTSPNISNFVHNAGITTEITNDYATMTTIGATAQNNVVGEDLTAFTKWNTGIIDRFKLDVATGRDLTAITTGSNPVLLNYYELLDQGTDTNTNEFTCLGLNRQYSSQGKWYSSIANQAALAGFNNTYSKTLQTDEDGDAITGGQINPTDPKRPIFIDSELISSNLNIVSNLYKEINKIAHRKDISKSSNEQGFMPFNLNLEVDGISGIKIYSKLKIQQSFLPSNYPQSLEFITTDVTHTLNNNKWVTKLNTIGMPAKILSTKNLMGSLFIGTYENLALKLASPNSSSNPNLNPSNPNIQQSNQARINPGAPSPPNTPPSNPPSTPYNQLVAASGSFYADQFYGRN